ncbi:regulatory protein [Propionicimonas paludicola]|uniref:Regulatory protein RecX n=1 Tax=Propionicimonas paludicola TaxID=185243 RepID=A0A2A9CR54_9ACTN|nr:regulatory protein RecX [Propionicimonas paludicola]PFG16565.1 regulatory protein [Propionicimonas paludicola]
MSARTPAGRVLSEQPEDSPTAVDQAADPLAVAREIALRQLTVRARSRQELAKALARKGVPEATAEQVLDRLTEVGLIDDAAFARDWLAAGGRRQRSRRALMAELGEKGVDREIIQDAVAELDSDQDYAVARAYAERKAVSLARLEPQVRYRRLTGALARRGFPSSVVAQVAREVLADLDVLDGGELEV